MLFNKIKLSKIKPILENVFMKKKGKIISILCIWKIKVNLLCNIFTELYLENYNDKIIQKIKIKKNMLLLLLI